MATPVIEAANVSKRFAIGDRAAYGSLREEITQAVLGPFRRLTAARSGAGGKGPDEAARSVWALKDVSFEVAEGAVVGIIGRNGAGKSTLLKILSRITEPTEGRIVLRGRLASLLEVGTGFHPELTGRENIFLNGALLGMRASEIRARFDEIVAFSEIERFLDTPVKRYSSGMYVRLAFAVAAHLTPEILVVDEVLSVGDAAFQRKCLGKMGEAAKGGRTVIFVSHNMGAVRALCDSAVLLDGGRVAFSGAVEDVIGRYLRSAGSLNCRYVHEGPPDRSKKAELMEVSVSDSSGAPSPVVLVDSPFSIGLRWRLNAKVPFMRAGVDLLDSSGAVVVSTMDTDTTGLHGVERSPAVYEETVEFPAFLLMPGVYSVRVFAGIPMVERIMEVNDAVCFEVSDNASHLSHVAGGRRPGYIATPLEWRVKTSGV